MNWKKGFTALYEVRKVNPYTWEDMDLVEITGGTITIQNEGIRNTASIQVTENVNDELIRIYLIAKQKDTERIPIFTGICSAPSVDIEGVRYSYSVDCFSPLKVISDILLPRGYYVPSGSDAIEMIKSLITSFTNYKIPFKCESGPAFIYSNIVAENNETCLTMVEKILSVICWNMLVDGRGRVIIKPKEDSVKEFFSPIKNDVIEPKLKVSSDWFNIPNVLRVYTDDRSVEVYDDDVKSLYSTTSRGREIWNEEKAELAAGESIEMYARKRLMELQGVSNTVAYTRRFQPDLNVNDVVHLEYPKQKIVGDYRIKNQKITIGYGCYVNEEVYKL